MVAVVVRHEAGAGVELQEDVAVADLRELEDEHRVVIPEAGEEVAVDEERGQAVRPAFSDAGEVEQQLARVREAHAPRGSWSPGSVCHGGKNTPGRAPQRQRKIFSAMT